MVVVTGCDLEVDGGDLDGGGDGGDFDGGGDGDDDDLDVVISCVLVKGADVAWLLENVPMMVLHTLPCCNRLVCLQLDDKFFGAFVSVCQVNNYLYHPE